jgi:hypothetical protein
MSDRGPGIITIALGVAFGLIIASEEGVIGHHANVNLADKTPAASAQQAAPSALKAPAVPSPSGMK